MFLSPLLSSVYLTIYFTIAPFFPYFQCAKIWFELNKKETVINGLQEKTIETC